LKSLKIPLPPKEIQQQIVDIYNYAVEEKRAKEQEAKELLEKAKREVERIIEKGK
jgi:restriction endonuclease S subunit